MVSRIYDKHNTLNEIFSDLAKDGITAVSGIEVRPDGTTTIYL